MKKLLSLILLLTPVYGVADSAPYALEAAKKPVAFAIVREDSLLDQELIQRYFPEDSVAMLMVASGGCTAAQLVAQSRLKTLTIIDPNPAQLALTKLKIHLLSLPVKKRMEILGYLPMERDERKRALDGLCLMLDIDPVIFGNNDLIANDGLDAAGRYEYVFEVLRRKLHDHRDDLEALFAMTDPEKQSSFIAPGTVLGDALDAALDEVMSQENLVAIFGEKATANRVQEFSRHFAGRIRAYLAHHTAASSPWMAHLLLGSFHQDKVFPWLEAQAKFVLPAIQYYQGYMDELLERTEVEAYHVIHLSNILDWLSPIEAERTLSLVYKALKPGGVVIIRQLNSNLDIPALGKDLVWDKKTAQSFLMKDRSFFYRHVLVGIKQQICRAPRVKELADKVLQETPVIESSFFKDLPTMDKKIFQHLQTQFFFAVDFFSRPMASLVSRLPLHNDRIDIIHNIVEEHGDFCVEHYHSNTFKKFLKSIGVDANLNMVVASPAVNMFNMALIGAALHEDPVVALSCLGIIEYAFADISALLAYQVVNRDWVKQEELVHYNLHADIDKQHAEEFFKVVESDMDNQEHRSKVTKGLALGVYIFNRLYEDLYSEARRVV